MGGKQDMVRVLAAKFASIFPYLNERRLLLLAVFTASVCPS